MSEQRTAASLAPKPQFLRASALDAGNMNMRAHGRTRWNEEDADVAAQKLDALVRACYSLPGDADDRYCFIRFQAAEAA